MPSSDDDNNNKPTTAARGEEDCCVICLEAGARVGAPCGLTHGGCLFHKGCLNRWLRTRARCPLCALECPAAGASAQAAHWLLRAADAAPRRRIFLPLAVGRLLVGAEERRAVRALERACRRALRRAGFIIPGDPAVVGVRMLSPCGASTVELTLERTALMDRRGQGRVAHDGVSLVAVRRRVLPPRRCRSSSIIISPAGAAVCG